MSVVLKYQSIRAHLGNMKIRYVQTNGGTYVSSVTHLDASISILLISHTFHSVAETHMAVS